MTPQPRHIVLSKKGFRELQEAITQIEQSLEDMTAALRDLDRTSRHDERQARIELLDRVEAAQAELADKQRILRTATRLPSKRSRLKVAMGSVVDLVDHQGRLFRYTLVDSFEANPSDGRISVASPLGRRLLGKVVNDAVEFSTRLGHNRLQVVRVG